MLLATARDGRLTAAELESAARAAFARADSDADGRISREESEKLRASLPREPEPEFVYDVYCPMPAAQSNDLIVLFGAYEGQEKRSAGSHPTGTATIHIEPGRRPIYLVLPSYEAVRWRLVGATDRVRQVVITSYEKGSLEDPRGVEGVPAKRVRAFGNEGCVRYFSRPGTREERTARAAVATGLGRGPDVVAGAYKATSVSLPSAEIQADANTRPSDTDVHPLARPRSGEVHTPLAADPRVPTFRQRVEEDRIRVWRAD